MLLHKTISICPVCKKEIEANVIEKYDSIFMEKICAEHGLFEVKIAKNAWYYKGLKSFYDTLFPPNFSEKKQCPIYTLFVTSRCNLNCPICFTDANKTAHLQEMPLSTIKKYLDSMREQRKIIRISGGEPTLREDLPEIIQLILKSGNYPYIFTNGLKLIDYSYLKILKGNGLRGIIMWLDSINNDEVHNQMRGQRLLTRKTQALENIKKCKMPFCLYHVKVKNINDNDTENIWSYVLKNDFVKSVWIKGYAHLGKKGFSRENEFILDELIEEISKVSKGIFTLEDMYYCQKLNYIWSALHNKPTCYYGPVILLPRGIKDESLKFTRYSKMIEIFEKKWQNSPSQARHYFYRKIIYELFKYSSISLFCFLLQTKLNRQLTFRAVHDFLPSRYFLLDINTFYDSWNYDKNWIYRQCETGVFNLSPEKNIPLCDFNVKNFG